MHASRRRLLPTRAGWWTAFGALLSLLLAWSGPKELVALPSAAFALLTLSGLVARFGTANAVLAVPAPKVVVAGADFRLPLTITAGARGLSPRDLLAWIDAGRGRRARPCGFLPIVPRGQSAEIELSLRIPERGRKRELSIELASTFPFGLFRGSLEYDLPLDLLVLPRLGSVRGLEESLTAGGGARLAGEHTRGQEEFFGLNDWREGESLRRVHWKLSARRGQRLVLDLRDQDEPPVQLLLVRECVGGRAGDRPHPSFEKAVSLTATLAEHFLRRGRAVQLGFRGREQEPLLRLRGRAGLLPMLAALAEVQPQDGDAWSCVTLGRSTRGEACVIVLAGGRSARVQDGDSLGPTPLVVDVDGEDARQLFDRRTRAAPLFLQGVSS